MDKKPIFLAAFIFFAFLILFPPVLKFFSQPELFLGLPLILVFTTGIALLTLIGWIFFYYFFYRK